LLPGLRSSSRFIKVLLAFLDMGALELRLVRCPVEVRPAQAFAGRIPHDMLFGRFVLCRFK